MAAGERARGHRFHPTPLVRPSRILYPRRDFPPPSISRNRSPAAADTAATMLKTLALATFAANLIACSGGDGSHAAPVVEPGATAPAANAPAAACSTGDASTDGQPLPGLKKTAGLFE